MRTARSLISGVEVCLFIVVFSQNIKSPTIPGRFTIYRYEQIEKVLKGEQVTTDAFEPSVKRSDENAYWIIIEDDSMQPAFQPKNLILLNPSLTPAPGDYVIATDDAD
ncbi:S24 family peptidase [Psychrobacter sp. DAB_AL62B]|uniref:S24 family peptidase n=1 Tax=Psychrobacter sp. DAB_AL62B TaxID=1028420 RepID=UPI002380FD26|nr:S24 family peptidase [Psychrobacter sp. DAB_AL62B]MDE4454829.1 S24 family peptidase [Psychrobacter sp. DAB_AL62B]